MLGGVRILATVFLALATVVAAWMVWTKGNGMKNACIHYESYHDFHAAVDNGDYRRACRHMKRLYAACMDAIDCDDGTWDACNERYEKALEFYSRYLNIDINILEDNLIEMGYVY